MIPYYWFTFTLMLACVLHSLLASGRVKQRISHWMIPGTYRLFYNFIAILTFSMPLWIYSRSVKIPWGRSYLVYPGLVLLVFGLFVIYRSFRAYDLGDFLGIHRLSAERNRLIRTGLQGRVRHPLYLGTLLVFTGFMAIDPNLWTLTAFLLIFFYIQVGIYWEEKKLLSEFGETYRQYQKEVPRILPRVFRS